MTRPTQETFVQRQEIELPPDAPDSFTIFQGVVHPMFDLTRLRHDEPFFARAAVTFLPDVLLSRAVNAAARFDRTRRTIARSGIDDVLVLVYLSGSFTFEVNGTSRPVDANHIAFFDLNLPFSIESQHVDNISLAVSRRRLAELMPTLDGIHGAVLSQGATLALLLAHLHACNEAAQRISTEESPAISAVTLQLVAGALLSAKRQVAGLPARAGMASLADMTNLIEDLLGRADLGPDLLMAAFNISRASLYRAFEPVGGVAAFILERRLNRALHAITAPHPTHVRLKQLAHDLGFAHPTSFTRAFKKRFGIPPHEVRSLRAYPDGVQSPAWRQALSAHLHATSPDGDPKSSHSPG
ncbi:MAG TPA: helix-turn-helix domain-containing protein [Candidatus Aquabacterium excrementipullorum]|nr:helix-turn-helix domain-containing protein [Candidatus Aquabacterium excrementipullorum]